MEFYTIPRIIHELVDNAGFANPEILIISVSLYILIGPFMFYFFVCKREVVKLLKQRFASSVKQSPPKSSTSASTKMSRIFRRSSSYETQTPAITPVSVQPTKYEVRCEDNMAFTPQE